MFGNGGTSEQRTDLARQNRSILDAVTDDFARLTQKLGPNDRTQVDEYLDSVREVERRIQAIERLGDQAGLPTLERPRGIPERFDDHVKLMFINGAALNPVPPVTPVAMGKATRGVELKSLDDLDERQITAWMQQVTAVAGVGGK